MTLSNSTAVHHFVVQECMGDQDFSFNEAKVYKEVSNMKTLLGLRSGERLKPYVNRELEKLRNSNIISLGEDRMYCLTPHGNEAVNRIIGHPEFEPGFALLRSGLRARGGPMRTKLASGLQNYKSLDLLYRHYFFHLNSSDNTLRHDNQDAEMIEDSSADMILDTTPADGQVTGLKNKGKQRLVEVDEQSDVLMDTLEDHGTRGKEDMPGSSLSVGRLHDSRTFIHPRIPEVPSSDDLMPNPREFMILNQSNSNMNDTSSLTDRLTNPAIVSHATTPPASIPSRYGIIEEWKEESKLKQLLGLRNVLRNPRSRLNTKVNVPEIADAFENAINALERMASVILPLLC